MDPIHTEGLTRRYKGGIVALDALSFSVKQGTMVGLVGPNGAGKTTAIKILTGLIRPTAGNAYLNGCDVAANPKIALRDIGAVVEVPEFYPFLTPLATLEYLGRLRGMEERDLRSRSEEVLIEFGLGDSIDVKIGRFSKGMKQRLALAQSVLHNPSVLILDEPADGLDPQGIVEMREVLMRLKRDGHTILISSHILPEVQETCDSIIIIDHGKLVANASIEEVSREAKIAGYEIALSYDVRPEEIEDIRTLPGVRCVETPTIRRMLVEVDPSSRGGEWLLKELMSRGLRIESFRPRVLPLESYYVQKRKESR